MKHLWDGVPDCPRFGFAQVLDLVALQMHKPSQKHQKTSMHMVFLFKLYSHFKVYDSWEESRELIMYCASLKDWKQVGHKLWWIRRVHLAPWVTHCHWGTRIQIAHKSFAHENDLCCAGFCVSDRVHDVSKYSQLNHPSSVISAGFLADYSTEASSWTTYASCMPHGTVNF